MLFFVHEKKRWRILKSISSSYFTLMVVTLERLVTQRTIRLKFNWFITKILLPLFKKTFTGVYKYQAIFIFKQWRQFTTVFQWRHMYRMILIWFEEFDSNMRGSSKMYIYLYNCLLDFKTITKIQRTPINIQGNLITGH